MLRLFKIVNFSSESPVIHLLKLLNFITYNFICLIKIKDIVENVPFAGAAGLIDTQPKNAELPPLKPEDIQYFDKLLMEVDESTLSKEELIEREIMTYLLKIKNGTPPQRKSGLRKITENARRFGAGALFNQILPLLMSPTLEDQERHLMVKVRTFA